MSEHREFDLLDEYALGTLGANDFAQVAGHLAVCADCRAEYDELRAVLDVLPQALAAAPPPAGLRGRIGAALGAPRVARPRLGAMRGLAAGLVVALIGDAALAWRLVRERDMRRAAIPVESPSVPTRASTASRRGANEALVTALRSGRVYALDGTVGDEPWHLTIVQPPHGAHALVFSGTPDAPIGTTYRAWVLRGKRTVSIGDLPAGKPATLEMPMALKSGDVVAFSREPVDSDDKPSSPFLMTITIGR